MRASLGFGLVALLAGASSVSGAALVEGIANNSIHQNPCLVTAYLQAQCAEGTFTMSPIAEGFHYIGPTNDTNTQNPCICSTPVYMLDSACGACQNRTFISWTSFSAFCPQNMISPEGTYSQIIPDGTLVPHWAFLKPSDSDDFFDPNAAKLVGDSPESSQILSSTTTSSALSTSTAATTPTSSPPASSTTGSSPSSPPSSGGGGGGSNTGAIVGGVVGGILGLALIALLAFFLYKRMHARGAAGRGGASAGVAGASAGHGAGPAGSGAYGGGNGYQDMSMAGAGAGAGLLAGQQYQHPTGSSDPSSQGLGGPYAQSQHTNPSGFTYNQPMDPNDQRMSYAPAPPQQPASTGFSYGTAPMYHQPQPAVPPQQPQGQYSGMPEV